MHANYWNIIDGQLSPDEILHMGCRDKDVAEMAAQALDARYRPTIRKLKTIESDHPIEDARYEPFPSARWCALVLRATHTPAELALIDS